jgi:hypothetical protein
MKRDRRLLVLAVAHFALSLVAAALAPIQVNTPSGLEHILIVPFCALVLCQAVLIALWAVASRAPLWIRLAGLAAGAVYLEALVPADMRREFSGVSTITIAVTAANLLAVQVLGVRLARHFDEAQRAGREGEGFKFSIRDLMLLTAVVALLTAGARVLQGSPRQTLLLVMIWAICFVAVGLAALWAGLGSAAPIRRWPVVVVLSAALGVFFAFAATAHQAGWIYIVSIMIIYPVLLLGSLLIVRSLGYRFVRRPMQNPDLPLGEPVGRTADRAHHPAGSVVP